MYVFYLDDLLLPVAPESVDTKVNNQNKTVTLINEGEINLLKSPGLTEISFTAFIPGVKYPWAVYHLSDFWHPINFLDRFEKLKTGLAPFDLIIARKWDDGSGLDFRTNMRVTLESYTIKEAAKNGKDIMVDIKLKQYKPFATKTIVVNDGSAAASGGREKPKRPEKYTTDYGDTLGGIAQKTMGDGTLWPQIYALNKDTIEKAAIDAGNESSMNGNIVVPYTVLKIPQE